MVADMFCYRLQFTHNGMTSALNTAADLAAWIEERKKRFPTKARIEENNKEKERRAAELRAARQEETERRKKKHDEAIEAQQKVKKEKVNEGQDDEQQRKREKYLVKAEKLRRKLEKSERKAAALAAAAPTDKNGDHASDLPKATAAADPPTMNDDPAAKLEAEGDDVQEPVFSDPTHAVTDLETHSIAADTEPPPASPMPLGLPSSDPVTLSAILATTTNEAQRTKADLGLSYAASTSSDAGASDHDSEDSMSISSSSSEPSDSSDSDSGAPPTETSSRRTGPTRVPPPPREDQARKFQQGDQKVCRYYAKHGRCALGAKCKFKHEGGPEKGDRSQRGGMALYQRLLLQEQKEEERLVLDAIKYLGSTGVLD